MGSYRVYKVGEEEHVREAAAAAPAPLEGGGGARRRGRARAAAPRRWWVWALIAAAAVAAALLLLVLRPRGGRQLRGRPRDPRRSSDKVPDWAVLGAPVVVVAAVALVTVYLAFGRHLAVKLIGVAVVVLVLATPGLAVGYANGLVSGVGGAAPAPPPRRTEEQAQIQEADTAGRPPDPATSR